MWMTVEKSEGRKKARVHLSRVNRYFLDLGLSCVLDFKKDKKRG